MNMLYEYLPKICFLDDDSNYSSLQSQCFSNNLIKKNQGINRIGRKGEKNILYLKLYGICCR